MAKYCLNQFTTPGVVETFTEMTGSISDHKAPATQPWKDKNLCVFFIQPGGKHASGFGQLAFKTKKFSTSGLSQGE